MSVPSIDDLCSLLAEVRPRSAALYADARRVIPGGTVSRARILPPFPFPRGARRGRAPVQCGRPRVPRLHAGA